MHFQEKNIYILIYTYAYLYFVYVYIHCVYAQLLSRVQLFVTPWTVDHQAPQSMEFPSQEYLSGLPFPPPGDLSDPGTEPMSPLVPALTGGFLSTEPLGKCYAYRILLIKMNTTSVLECPVLRSSYRSWMVSGRNWSHLINPQFSSDPDNMLNNTTNINFSFSQAHKSITPILWGEYNSLSEFLVLAEF